MKPWHMGLLIIMAAFAAGASGRLVDSMEGEIASLEAASAAKDQMITQLQELRGYHEEQLSLALAELTTYRQAYYAVTTGRCHPEILDIVKRTGIDPAFTLRFIHEESRCDPLALSPAGARGLMQVRPLTANTREPGSAAKLFYAEPNLRLGVAEYREWLWRRGGDQILAIQSYNQGGNVDPLYGYEWAKRIAGLE